MIKKVLSVVCICSMLLGVNGCDKSSVAQREENVQEMENRDEREKNMEQKRITKKTFLEYYGIAEEEMEGIDINSFVNTYDIKLDDTDVNDIRLAIQLYKENFGDMGLMSYAYMLKEPANAKFTPDKVNNVIRVAWEENHDESVEAIVFDFENEQIYEGADMEEFDKNDLAGTTDDTIKQKVIQLITDYEIYDWKDYYKGGSMKDTTGGYSWTLAIEFSDGTIYRTGGGGSGKEARPDNMYDFITALRECESKNTPVSE